MAPVLAGPIAAAAVAALAACADMASACDVRLSRNWAAVRGGFGTLIMARDGPPCGAAILADADTKVPASALGIIAGPAHGRLSVEGPSFAYQPDPGFSGEDRFILVGSGQRRGRFVRLRGVVTAIVR